MTDLTRCQGKDCPERPIARRLCQKHYQRWRLGKPIDGADEKVCEVCGKIYKPYHYQRQRVCSLECRNNLPDRLEYQRAYEASEERRLSQRLVRQQRRAASGRGQKTYDRRANLKKNYGVTLEWFDAKLAEQGGVCAICDEPPDPNGSRAAANLHIDHDHATGKLRDLLCCRCNQGIGYFREDADLLRKVIAYVERHRAD